MIAVHLLPRSSFRAPLSSDTLWGLVLGAVRAVEGKAAADEIAELCKEGKPPFRMSSAFPFDRDGGKYRYYFPRPYMPSSPAIDGGGSPEGKEHFPRKEFKKARFMSMEVFESFLNGEMTESGWYEEGSWKDAPVIRSFSVLHTSIDRLTGTTREESGRGQLFASRECIVQAHSGVGETGLYFLTDSMSAPLASALRYLAHFGFGGDASVGKSMFDVSWDDTGVFSLRTPERPTHFVTLSLYSPKPAELETIRSNPDSTWYDIETRTGRTGPSHSGGNYRKPGLVMFREGSTFPWWGEPVIGRAHVLMKASDHDIIQYGFAFPIPAVFRGSSK